MFISKKDALTWFEFFAMLPEEEPLGPRQQEIASAVFSQLELAAEDRFQRLMAEIPGLKGLAAASGDIVPWRPELPFRTLFVGPEDRFPAGCRSCLTGTGLSAVRKTNRCDAACPFCYDCGQLDAIPPIGEGLWEIGGTRYREEDLPLLLALSRRPTGVAYVYLEPFMEIEKYYGVVRRFHEAGIHQHLYTNGIHANERNLAELADAGLDEIRFNLGATRASDHVIDMIAEAKKRFPRVGIETPMTWEFYEAFLAKQDRILAAGPDFMNCAELHLNENNLANYAGESLYFLRMGYLSPMISRELTLRLMKRADREGWPMVLHDCSNHTKFARDIHQKTAEGGWFGQSSYGCEFASPPYAAFLPALRDPEVVFLREEELPQGYRPGEVVL